VSRAGKKGGNVKEEKSGLMPPSWCPGSWPMVGVQKLEEREEKPRMLYGFIVEGEDPSGGCPEHPTAGSVLVKNYAYIYPDGSARKISLGWVCKNCLKRGQTSDGPLKVHIVAWHEVDDRRPRRY